MSIAVILGAAMRSGFPFGFFIAALMALSLPAMAQDEPSSTPLCDLPEYEGTAIYEKYCGGGSSSRDDYSDPAPPAFDAEGDARNRIGALIRNFPDVINQGAWSGANFDGSANLDAGLSRLRHEIWSAFATSGTALMEQNHFIAEAKVRQAEMTARLNATNQDRELADAAMKSAEQERAELETQIAQIQALTNKEAGMAAQAEQIWLKARNGALKSLRAAYPQIQGLPMETGSIAALPHAKFPEPPAPFTQAAPQPMGGIIAPNYVPSLPLRAGNFVPTAEPPAPAGITARISDVEFLAARARSSIQDLRSAKAQADAAEQIYNASALEQEHNRGQLEAVRRQLDYVEKLDDYLNAKKFAAEDTYRAMAWRKTDAAARALTWDIFDEKILAPALAQLPHYAAAERAGKAAALAKQIVQIEQNFELMAAAAAKTLALGAARDTNAVMDRVWGAHGKQAEETVDRTLEVIDAPPEAAKGWKAFFAATGGP